MNAEKLKELERLLSESDDFAVPLGFFMDNFADKPYFTQGSDKTKAPLIKMMLTDAGQSLFKKIPVRLTHLKMLVFEQLSIIHGCGFMDGHMCTFFYCKRINQGLMYVDDGRGGMHLTRMTPKPLDNYKLTEDFVDLIQSEDDITKEFRHKYPN